MNMTSLIYQYQQILPNMVCPLCSSRFHIHSNSLICENGHCYDFSKKGYVNFVPAHQQDKEKYNEALFEARKTILNAGFYRPVLDSIASFLADIYGETSFTLLDVGCGEGYYSRSLADRFGKSIVIGSDISRAAIISAAQASHQPLWMIANLKKMPFANQGVNVLLDILTPADYTEFQRITGDYLIKVIPGNDCLKEIRHAVAQYLSGGESYNNQEVVNHLRESIPIADEHRLIYTLPLSSSECSAFLRMTPLTFTISDELLNQIQLSEITIDMNVFLCQLHESSHQSG